MSDGEGRRARPTRAPGRSDCGSRGRRTAFRGQAGLDVVDDPGDRGTPRQSFSRRAARRPYRARGDELADRVNRAMPGRDALIAKRYAQAGADAVVAYPGSTTDPSGRSADDDQDRRTERGRPDHGGHRPERRRSRGSKEWDGTVTHRRRTASRSRPCGPADLMGRPRLSSASARRDISRDHDDEIGGGLSSSTGSIDQDVPVLLRSPRLRASLEAEIVISLVGPIAGRGPNWRAAMPSRTPARAPPRRPSPTSRTCPRVIAS